MSIDINIPAELIPSDPRFGCGPSLIPVEYVKNLAETGTSLLGTSHRKPAIKNLVKSVQENLRTYFSLADDYQVVVGNGGATMLFDMLGLGLAKKGSFHHVCGEFSSKWSKSSKLIPWIEAGENAVDYGQGITPYHEQGYDLTCMTLNETSTGVKLDKLPEFSEDSLTCVDATSGAGQVECDVNQTDVFFFSPQKVFASEGGLFVAIMSKRAVARALEIAADSSRYIPGFMDFKVAIENSAKNQTYTTPSVSTLFFLNEQLNKMNNTGYANVIKESNRKAELLYGWADSKDYLSPYIKDAKYRSNAVATIDVDDKVNTSEIISFLEKKEFAYGIDAYRKLGRNQFRISMFDNIKYDDLERLTKILSLIIER